MMNGEQWETYSYRIPHAGMFVLNVRSGILGHLNERNEVETQVVLDTNERKVLNLLLEKQWCRDEEVMTVMNANTLDALQQVIVSLDAKVQPLGLVIRMLNTVGFVILDSVYRQSGGW